MKRTKLYIVTVVLCIQCTYVFMCGCEQACARVARKFEMNCKKFELTVYCII